MGCFGVAAVAAGATSGLMFLSTLGEKRDWTGTTIGCFFLVFLMIFIGCITGSGGSCNRYDCW